GTARSYHTGDIARRLPDGRYEFLGRADDQVKLNGARVELGEVEAHLLACPGVLRAVALRIALPQSANKLVPFVLMEPAMDANLIRQRLRERVAAVLIPHEILQIDALPLQISDKVDRQALARIWHDRALSGVRNAAQPAKLPENLDERVLGIWRHAL